MKFRKKQIVINLLLIFLFNWSLQPINAQEANIEHLNAQAIVISQGQSGQVLYEKNEEALVDVGMVSKLLAIYLIYQEIDKGSFQLEDSVSISDDAYQLSQDYSILNVPLRQDFNYTVQELLQAVAIRHANGALIALIEKTGMDELEFINQMNEILQEWELDDQNFINVTGMSENYSPIIVDSGESGRTNQMSARALATVAYRLINDYPEFLNLTEQKSVKFKKETDDSYLAENVNALISQSSQKGVRGLSIGYSPKDGWSQVMVQENDDNQLIAVVLGVDEAMENPYYNVLEALNYGFNNFTITNLLEEGNQALELPVFKVKNGEKATVQAIYKSSFNYYQKNKDGQIKYQYHFENQDGEPNKFQFEAPISKNEVLGRVMIEIEDVKLNYLPTSQENKIEVLSNEAIEENRSILNWLGNQWINIGEQLENIRKFFTKLFN